MAKIDFSQIKTGSNTSDSKIDFFSLKNDNDEAVVRFVQDDVSDFEILTIHTVTTNDGKFRKISCLRDPYAPMENCPLCKSGNPVQQKFYIKLIQYEKDAAGNVVAVPKIWERSVKYAQQLKSYIDNYGPLSDLICKVIRHGTAKDMKTTYEIIPNLNKNIYRDDIYVKDTSFFDDYKVLGTSVPERTVEEMNRFLETGSFLEVKNDTNVSNTVSNSIPSTTVASTFNASPANIESAVNAPSFNAEAPSVNTAPVTNSATMPWERPRTNETPAQTASNTTFDRPRRY